MAQVNSEEYNCSSVPLCLEPIDRNERSSHSKEDNNVSFFNILFYNRRHPVAQDGKWACIALVAAALVQFIIMGIHNSFGVIYSEILEEFKWKRSISAFIGSSAVGINFLLSPIGTQLCESYSPQSVTIFGGLISVAGLLGSSFVLKDYAILISYSIVWGTGSSLCYSSTYVIVGKLFHRHLALAMGVVTAGSGLGQLAMGPSIESMLERFGWKVTMRSLAILACLLVVAAFTYREPQRDRPSVRTKWSNLFDCTLWCVPGFLILTLSLAVFNFGYYIPIVHVPNYAKEMGASKKDASFLISFMAVPSVISRLAFGKLGDHPKVNRLLMFQVCLGMMALATILCPFVSSEYAGFAVYMVFFGTGEGCIVGTAPTIVGDVVGRARIAPALGILFFSFAGPLTAGPYVAGWLFNETDRYEEAFFVAGGTMFFCLLTLTIIHCLPKRTSTNFETNVDNIIALDEQHVPEKNGLPRSPDVRRGSNNDEQPLYTVHVSGL